jgi:hypothetical protein
MHSLSQICLLIIVLTLHYVAVIESKSYPLLSLNPTEASFEDSEEAESDEGIVSEETQIRFEDN